jgi:hypothetical protein
LIEPYGIIAIFYVLVVFGTAWGFTRIIFPLFGITWTALRITTLTLLMITPLFSGAWFRLFGYNGFDIAWVGLNGHQKQELRLYRENNHEFNGHWNPNWREQHGIEPLPADWDGESYHRWPALASLLIPAGLFGIYAGANWVYNRRKYGISSWRADPNHAIRTTPSMDNLNKRLNKIMAESLPYLDDWNVKIDPALQRYLKPQVVGAPAAPAAPKQDPRFAAALRGLGYKDKDIRAVADQCTETDLEARVKHALRLLTRQ